MKKKEISFLIPTRISLTTLLPYIKYFINSDFSLHIIGSSDVLKIVKDELNSKDKFELYPLEEIRKKRRAQSYIHKFLLLLFTSKKYSNYWENMITNQKKNANLLVKLFFTSIEKSPFKINKNKINNSVHKLTCIYFKNPFPTDIVISTTVQGDSYLLASKKIKTISILESWDQPTKMPRGYLSKIVLVWNSKLKKDWFEYQDSSRVEIGYPTKLNYVIESKPFKENIESKLKKTTIMYPATFGNSSNSLFFEEELKLILIIAKITNRLGINLIVKPKPNGKLGEFTLVSEKYDNVIIGKYQELKNQADYFLSDDYNIRRIEELEEVDLVINLGTTFAFDAALYGLPILQLESLNSVSFPTLTHTMSNYHLKQYILKDKEIVKGFSSETDIEKAILQSLFELNNNKDGIIWRMKDMLLRFVSPEKTFKEAAELLVSLTNEMSEN